MEADSVDSYLLLTGVLLIQRNDGWVGTGLAAWAPRQTTLSGTKSHITRRLRKNAVTQPHSGGLYSTDQHSKQEQKGETEKSSCYLKGQNWKYTWVFMFFL